ncbi:MAG: hypothetical protein ACFCVK_23570 [Acidimicrobiales bacterium]
MLNPTPGRLLAGVADALDETVLPALERGPARDQVRAAVGIVRRCARAIDAFGPTVHADCVDVAGSLRAIAAADPDLVTDRVGFDVALDGAERVLAQSYPPVGDLVEVALALHAVVADVAVAVERHGSDQRAAVRALLQRMNDRQRTLDLSPW